MFEFEKEKNSFVPVVLYIDYINAEYKKYLKDNFKDISPRDFIYLVNIHYHPNISQRELADLLFVTEANVGQVIKRLEKYNLIVRDFDEKNKSRRIISLTDIGKSVVFTLLEVSMEWESNFFENYDDDQKKMFIQMLSDYFHKSRKDKRIS